MGDNGHSIYHIFYATKHSIISNSLWTIVQIVSCPFNFRWFWQMCWYNVCSTTMTWTFRWTFHVCFAYDLVMNTKPKISIKSTENDHFQFSVWYFFFGVRPIEIFMAHSIQFDTLANANANFSRISYCWMVL